MDQAQLEIELGAWKNIAIDKQVLVSEVASALGLNDDCTNEQLKIALKSVVGQASEAESKVKAAQDNVDSLKKELANNAKLMVASKDLETQANAARLAADEALSEAKELEEKAQRRIQAARAANAEELKKVTQQLKDKHKELQAINKTLADTPENVVKKLKALKKEKFDESSARKNAEADSRTLRKQVKELEQETELNKDLLAQCAKLEEPVNELKKLCNAQKDQLAGLLEDASALADIPELDESIFEKLEPYAEKEE